MGYKLLVVDDDKAAVKSLKAVLEKEKYAVCEAFDGEEALARVEDFNPDIVLLDLMMPKLNGFDVLKKLRDDKKGKWRPVIIISAKTELDALKSCYDLEADHYISKPFKINDLLRGIKVVISLIPAHLG
jgi:DNA-binding response OmpR family regulator